MFPAPFLLHAPDGFFSVPVSVAFWVVTAAVLAISVREANRSLEERTVPTLGVLAAFIFAAQMVNFQVAGGTSGHLLGGVLAAVLLGPWAGSIVMASVIAVQALVFQDGGLVVMGANIFNMGIIGTLGGYVVYRAIASLGRGWRWQLGAAAVAAWFAVEAAAVVTAFQLALSDTSPLNVALPAMAGVHALIGLGEAAITVAALAFIASVRPDLLQARERAIAAGGEGHAGGLRGALRSGPAWLAAGIVASALVVVVLAPFASADPDGLERVATDYGFDTVAQANPYEILPGYTVPGLGGTASTVVSGLLGVLLVLAVVLGAARIVAARRAARLQREEASSTA
jgi:cobalt/nickel transport system permease protein